MSPWLSELFLRSQSDERLVELVRAGHGRAFGVIVERYRGPLHGVARRLSFDGRAEDVVQQTFTAAFAALQSGTEVRHLRGWLHQILRHVALRMAGPSAEELDPAHPDLATRSTEETVEDRALALAALTEVSWLPDRQREAFVQTVL